MVAMENLSPIVASILSENNPKAKQLVSQISQMLLEADLTVQLVNAVLLSAWYTLIDTGKIGPTNSQVEL